MKPKEEGIKASPMRPASARRTRVKMLCRRLGLNSRVILRRYSEKTMRAPCIGMAGLDISISEVNWRD